MSGFPNEATSYIIIFTFNSFCLILFFSGVVACMKDKIYKIINIRFSESGQVFDLLTVQFFIGLANALVNIVAFTLFIYNFPISALPEVYMILAVLLILINLVYEKLEHALKPHQLLKLIIALSGGIILLLWLGLAGGDKNTFIYFFMIASMLLYMITGYAFWGLVSLLFNVRESRRVFSIVGSGDIPAKLIGYVAVPVLIHFVGIYNVLWFAAGAFGIAFYFFDKYTRKPSWEKLKHHHIDHEHKTLGKKDVISFLFGHRLIFAISLLSILSYNVFILIDYTFISQVKARFANMADLASWIAIFFALGRLIAMIFKIIFTSRVIERLGVVNSLFITPATLLVFCFILFYSGFNNNMSIYIFGLMAMFTEVLRSTMQEPVFFILFQPLREQLRLKGHIISKGYMYPPSLIIVGFSLWMLHRSGNDITILQAIEVVIVNLFIWAGIIFFIGKAYLHTVHASIKKGMFSGSGIHVYDHQTIRILLDKVRSGKPREVIYALDLLEKAGYDKMVPLLEEQLKGNDRDIQKYSLAQLDQKESINTGLLKKMLLNKDDELYPVVVNLLCKYDMKFLDEMADDLSQHDYQVRKCVIIHLFDKREFRHLLKAGTGINELIESENTSDKELAIDIISEMKHLRFDDIILKMLTDEYSVKRKAIIAACKLNLKPTLPVILGMLKTPADRYIVLKGLLVYGDVLFEHINELQGVNVNEYSSELIKTAGQLKGDSSKKYLLAFMHQKELKSAKVIHALWNRDFKVENKEEKVLLHDLLQKHISEGINKIGDVSVLQESAYRQVMSDSVTHEIKEHLVLSLKICSFLYSKKEVNRVIELLELSSAGKIYNAMEMLDLVLPKRISKEVNKLFEFILEPNNQHIVKAPVSAFFERVVYREPVIYNDWTQAICVYCGWKNNEWELLNGLNKLKVPDENQVLRETNDYVLSYLNKNNYADHRKDIVA